MFVLMWFVSWFLDFDCKIILYRLKFLRFRHLLPFQNFAAVASQDYDNPKVKPSASANAIYSLACRYFVLARKDWHNFCSPVDHNVVKTHTKAIQYILGRLFPLKTYYNLHIYSSTINILGLFVLRSSSALRSVTGEEARDSEEESEYMIPSSRPVLPPITAPPVGESPPVLRPSQPLSALQTQTQVSTLNSRYS